MNPEYHKSSASADTLRQRSELLQQLRSHFLERQFVEVETPLLSTDSVIDLYLDPFVVPLPDGQRFLQTSPEFGMKRLLVSGLSRIFQITRAFRSEEAGPRHNPEFTMLEWYDCGLDYAEGRQQLAQLLDALLPMWGWDLAACKQQTYADTFEEVTGLHPFLCDLEALSGRAELHGLTTLNRYPDALARRECLNAIWALEVDPDLGRSGPVIIYDWPASDAALSQTRWQHNEHGQSFEVAHRYEVYFQGLELANGYHELLDPQVLRQRNQLTNQQRIQTGKSPLPEDSFLLQAMQDGLPASCGCALGVDRLLMALLSLDDIRQVIAFPWQRS